MDASNWNNSTVPDPGGVQFLVICQESMPNLSTFLWLVTKTFLCFSPPLRTPKRPS